MVMLLLQEIHTISEAAIFSRRAHHCGTFSDVLLQLYLHKTTAALMSPHVLVGDVTARVTSSQGVINALDG